jgi:hypothetical protein
VQLAQKLFKNETMVEEVHGVRRIFMRDRRTPACVCFSGIDSNGL